MTTAEPAVTDADRDLGAEAKAVAAVIGRDWRGGVSRRGRILLWPVDSATKRAFRIAYNFDPEGPEWWGLLRLAEQVA
jgi:hypothetical protein